MPKFKKLRQWSHDSLANLTQLTNRAVATASHLNERNQKSPDIHPSSSGISTISQAIREQQIDPKKDNFGLYALKCDRSKSLANARRGILLNLPSSSSSGVKLKGTGSFQTIERTHEVFKSCEAVDDDENANDNPRKLNQKATKIAPPPRKKKKQNLQSTQQRLNKAGYASTAAFEQLERNDSGLYKIVHATETAKITFVEPKAITEVKNATVAVKPKIEKAFAVKALSYEVKRSINPKVKDYQWHQQQRKPNREGYTKKIAPKPILAKKSFSLDPINTDIDIFKSNRLMDQKKLFDEFDELFEKNNQKMEAAPKSPTLAFRRLSELKKFPSSSFSISTDDDESYKREIKLITPPVQADFILKATQSVEDSTVTRKPKIISEQIKNVQQRKILYYNDEDEMQELIKSRMTGVCDVKETENSTSSLNRSDKHTPSQQVITTHSNSTKSNSLRIFSNEGIFVFNL